MLDRFEVIVALLLLILFAQEIPDSSILLWVILVLSRSWR